MLKKILVTASVVLMLSGCASTKKHDVEAETLDAMNSELEKLSIDKVYFGFDKSEISKSDLETLKKQADWLKNNSTVDVEVEGHCDSRGTVDYNLALGERRAHSVKKYLVQVHGINSERVGTISYGKERPAVLGDNEEAFALNRRGVTVIVKK
jgi:peptidoglycan-associated lipoprotein